MKEPEAVQPKTLFKEAILSPGNDELLSMIKERAAEIVDSLDNPEDMEISHDDLRHMDPLWVARVYEALSPTGFDWQSIDTSSEFYAHVDEEYEIGRAYELALIPGLPDRLADLPGSWLARAVPKVADDEMKDVLNSPSARGAERLSYGLAKYGVAPLTVLDATDAVARLLDRCIRTGKVNGSEPIYLSHYGVNDLLSAERLADEVSRVADCRGLTARVLLDWSIEVAQVKPLLFNGYTAETSGEAVTLIRTGEKQNNLYERWGRTSSFLFRHA